MTMMYHQMYNNLFNK